MAEKGRLVIRATHEYVGHPDAAPALEMWARLLAEAFLGRQPGPPLSDAVPAARQRRRPG